MARLLFFWFFALSYGAINDQAVRLVGISGRAVGKARNPELIPSFRFTRMDDKAIKSKISPFLLLISLPGILTSI
jgi:hypothetical protein